MSNFDINSYMDSVEMEEYWNDDYHSLTGQIDYLEI